MDDGTTILGIDPGTNLLGFGVVRVQGRKPVYVDMGVLDMRKDRDPYQKLRQIYDTVTEVCRNYHPDVVALESPFYGKNAQVILKLGRAQGAAMIAAMEYGVQVVEYAPRKAKEAITGNGAASKEQVSVMIQKTLGVTLDDRYLDATDALAIALCHYYQETSPLISRTKGSSGWEAFLKANPDRIKNP